MPASPRPCRRRGPGMYERVRAAGWRGRRRRGDSSSAGPSRSVRHRRDLPGRAALVAGALPLSHRQSHQSSLHARAVSWPFHSPSSSLPLGGTLSVSSTLSSASDHSYVLCCLRTCCVRCLHRYRCSARPPARRAHRAYAQVRHSPHPRQGSRTKVNR